MAAYATADELRAYVQDDEEAVAPSDDAAAERLLERAQRVVDLLLGPRPLLESGLRLDPAQLTAAQAAALSRATCAAAEFELVNGAELAVGGDDFSPGEVAVLRRAPSTPPKAVAELAGTGLVLRSGCATPSPPVDEYAPACVDP